MRMRDTSIRKTARRVLIVGVAMLMAAVAGGASAAQPEAAGVVAVFEGETLDLARSWDDANACLVWQQKGITECFRTEAEMDTRIAALDTASVSAKSGGGGTTASTCSGYLRLYDATSYGSPVLYLRDQYRWLNLSNYGFNQRVSSFKVGPCATDFADYANGGGSWYPWYMTEAYDQSSTMISGWDNDVSSVYIN
jgi:hypothetical protein